MCSDPPLAGPLGTQIVLLPSVPTSRGPTCLQDVVYVGYPVVLDTRTLPQHVARVVDEVSNTSHQPWVPG